MWYEQGCAFLFRSMFRVEAACWRSIPCRCRASALPWVNSSLEASSLFYACLVQFVRASSLVCSWCLFTGVCRFVLIGGLQLALTALLYVSQKVGIKADKLLSIRFALCDHFAVASNINKCGQKVCRWGCLGGGCFVGTFANGFHCYVSLPPHKKKEWPTSCRLSILNWHFRVTHPLAPFPIRGLQSIPLYVSQQ